MISGSTASNAVYHFKRKSLLLIYIIYKTHTSVVDDDWSVRIKPLSEAMLQNSHIKDHLN